MGVSGERKAAEAGPWDRMLLNRVRTPTFATNNPSAMVSTDVSSAHGVSPTVAITFSMDWVAATCPMCARAGLIVPVLPRRRQPDGELQDGPDDGG